MSIYLRIWIDTLVRVAAVTRFLFSISPLHVQQKYVALLWDLVVCFALPSADRSRLFPDIIVYVMWKLLRLRTLLGHKNWLFLVLPPFWRNVQLEIPQRHQIFNVWHLGTFRKLTRLELSLVKHWGSNLLISFKTMNTSLSLSLSLSQIPFTSIELSTLLINLRWIKDYIDLQTSAAYINLHYFSQSVFHSLTR